jgi:hypothetical protein
MTTQRRPANLAVCLAALFAAAGCSSPSSVDDGGGVTPGGYNHLRSPGSSSGDLLAAADFSRLVVQVQYVAGAAPSAAGLQALEAFLNARLNKPGGITIMAPQPIAITQQATYSAAQIRAIEQAHRTVYTEGTTIAAYFLFIDGEYSGGANVLGIAYNNTSMAIFGEKIGQYTGGLGQPSAATVEATVASHEFGHILGLVNNGSAMQTEHQDEPHGHHCDDPDCLMYWAVETSDFIANLLGGAVPDLNPDCLDDLQANGGR